MLNQSRRTVTALAVSFGFFATLVIAEPGFAIAGNNDIAQR
jgi:hypothetical protein